MLITLSITCDVICRSWKQRFARKNLFFCLRIVPLHSCIVSPRSRTLTYRISPASLSVNKEEYMDKLRDCSNRQSQNKPWTVNGFRKTPSTSSSTMVVRWSVPPSPALVIKGSHLMSRPYVKKIFIFLFIVNHSWSGERNTGGYCVWLASGSNCNWNQHKETRWKDWTACDRSNWSPFLADWNKKELFYFIIKDTQ